MNIKSQDTAITFSDTLRVDGTPVDLTGATVLFLMTTTERGSLFSAAATVVSAAEGTVNYQPGGGFPTLPGAYLQEWEVTFTNGRRLTFPSAGYNQITIVADLN